MNANFNLLKNKLGLFMVGAALVTTVASCGKDDTNNGGGTPTPTDCADPVLVPQSPSSVKQKTTASLKLNITVEDCGLVDNVKITLASGTTSQDTTLTAAQLNMATATTGAPEVAFLVKEATAAGNGTFTFVITDKNNNTATATKTVTIEAGSQPGEPALVIPFTSASVDADYYTEFVSANGTNDWEWSYKITPGASIGGKAATKLQRGGASEWYFQGWGSASSVLKTGTGAKSDLRNAEHNEALKAETRVLQMNYYRETAPANYGTNAVYEPAAGTKIPVGLSIGKASTWGWDGARNTGVYAFFTGNITKFGEWETVTFAFNPAGDVDPVLSSEVDKIGFTINGGYVGEDNGNPKPRDLSNYYIYNMRTIAKAQAGTVSNL